MEVSKFILGTVKEMNESCFEELKGKLIGEYITFSIMDEKTVNVDIFSEKLCDYFEKLELKTSDGFEKLIKKYISDWDTLVENKIVKEVSDGKEGSAANTSRARKYYSHAERIKESRSITLKQLTDYSRIIMCLYMAIIEKKFKEIEDFDYSAKCLDIDIIISAMRLKRSSGFLGIGSGAMFDTSDLYSSDTGVFILTIIMYYYIKSKVVEGEY